MTDPNSEDVGYDGSGAVVGLTTTEGGDTSHRDALCLINLKPNTGIKNQDKTHFHFPLICIHCIHTPSHNMCNYTHKKTHNSLSVSMCVLDFDCWKPNGC